MSHIGMYPVAVLARPQGVLELRVCAPREIGRYYIGNKGPPPEPRVILNYRKEICLQGIRPRYPWFVNCSTRWLAEPGTTRTSSASQQLSTAISR